MEGNEDLSWATVGKSFRRMQEKMIREYIPIHTPVIEVSETTSGSSSNGDYKSKRKTLKDIKREYKKAKKHYKKQKHKMKKNHLKLENSTFIYDKDKYTLLAYYDIFGGPKNSQFEHTYLPDIPLYKRYPYVINIPMRYQREVLNEMHQVIGRGFLIRSPEDKFGFKSSAERYYDVDSSIISINATSKTEPSLSFITNTSDSETTFPQRSNTSNLYTTERLRESNLDMTTHSRQIDLTNQYINQNFRKICHFEHGDLVQEGGLMSSKKLSENNKYKINFTKDVNMEIGEGGKKKLEIGLLEKCRSKKGTEDDWLKYAYGEDETTPIFEDIKSGNEVKGKQLLIIEDGLKFLPESVKLTLEAIQLRQHLYDSTSLHTNWINAIQTHFLRRVVWKGYIYYLLANTPLQNISSTIQSTLTLLSQLAVTTNFPHESYAVQTNINEPLAALGSYCNTKQPSNQIVRNINQHEQLNECYFQLLFGGYYSWAVLSGHIEEAVAFIQLFIYLTLYSPFSSTQLDKEQRKSALEVAKSLWESEAPRVGEEGASYLLQTMKSTQYEVTFMSEGIMSINEAVDNWSKSEQKAQEEHNKIFNLLKGTITNNALSTIKPTHLNTNETDSYLHNINEPHDSYIRYSDNRDDLKKVSNFQNLSHTVNNINDSSKISKLLPHPNNSLHSPCSETHTKEKFQANQLKVNDCDSEDFELEDKSGIMVQIDDIILMEEEEDLLCWRSRETESNLRPNTKHNWEEIGYTNVPFEAISPLISLSQPTTLTCYKTLLHTLDWLISPTLYRYSSGHPILTNLTDLFLSPHFIILFRNTPSQTFNGSPSKNNYSPDIFSYTHREFKNNTESYTIGEHIHTSVNTPIASQHCHPTNQNQFTTSFNLYPFSLWNIKSYFTSSKGIHADARTRLICLIAAQGMIAYPTEILLPYTVLMLSDNIKICKRILKQYEHEPLLWLTYAASLYSKENAPSILKARNVLKQSLQIHIDHNHALSIFASWAHLELIHTPITMDNPHPCNTSHTTSSNSLNKFDHKLLKNTFDRSQTHPLSSNRQLVNFEKMGASSVCLYIACTAALGDFSLLPKQIFTEIDKAPDPPTTLTIYKAHTSLTKRLTGLSNYDTGGFPLVGSSYSSCVYLISLLNQANYTIEQIWEIGSSLLVSPQSKNGSTPYSLQQNYTNTLPPSHTIKDFKSLSNTYTKHNEPHLFEPSQLDEIKRTQEITLTFLVAIVLSHASSTPKFIKHCVQFALSYFPNNPLFLSLITQIFRRNYQIFEMRRFFNTLLGYSNSSTSIDTQAYFQTKPSSIVLKATIQAEFYASSPSFEHLSRLLEWSISHSRGFSPNGAPPAVWHMYLTVLNIALKYQDSVLTGALKHSEIHTNTQYEFEIPPWKIELLRLYGRVATQTLTYYPYSKLAWLHRMKVLDSKRRSKNLQNEFCEDDEHILDCVEQFIVNNIRMQCDPLYAVA